MSTNDAAPDGISSRGEPPAVAKAKRKEKAIVVETAIPMGPPPGPPAPSDRVAFKAINPFGEAFQVFVTAKRARWVGTRGMGAILEIKHTVAAVLADPAHIHEGIRWEEDEDRDKASNVDSWLCYCGTPPTYYDPNSVAPLPSSPDHVFLIFVNQDRVAYNWRWERADGLDDGHANGHVTRFQRKVL